MRLHFGSPTHVATLSFVRSVHISKDTHWTDYVAEHRVSKMYGISWKDSRFFGLMLFEPRKSFKRQGELYKGK